jgi:hypothetical protein
MNRRWTYNPRRIRLGHVQGMLINRKPEKSMRSGAYQSEARLGSHWNIKS